MRIQRFLIFLLTSVSAGLAAAFIVLVMNPQMLQETVEPATDTTPPHTAPTRVAQHGPVSYADAVARAAPSVVNIYAAKIRAQRPNPLLEDPLLRRFFGDRLKPQQRLETSLGSGVILESRGVVLTNNHVIEDADQIRVVLANGRTLNATVVGTDPDTDLAVIRVDAKELPAISSATPGAMRVGDVVLAIGNPFGVGQTVTQGIVSATGRSQLGINTFENFIQTDAAINPGNSGGALINAHGELVGINTAIYSRTGGSQGIGFAIPADLARGVMQQILDEGRVVRGWLGIAGQDVTPALAESFGLHETRGVLISAVLEDGPAQQAGLRPGDVIVQVDEDQPAGAFDILNLIAVRPPGTRVRIKGWRGDEELDVEAVIQERPQDAAVR